VSEPAGKFRVEIWCDGADADDMLRAYEGGLVRGFTTNPTLMRKAGVSDYEAFARKVLGRIRGAPVCFEVFSDDMAEMERQARKISSWGPDVFVKIPVTDTAGGSCAGLAARLSSTGVKVNVTAILALDQVREVASALHPGTPSIVSVFAGRIADTGRDPVPIMREALEMLRPLPLCRLLWASPRELLNLVQAEECGCHIITLTEDLRRKLPLLGKGLSEMSLDTVRMFHEDARKAGYAL
jgi:transaldolase